METGLKDKVVLITGGGSGIGAATANMLVAEGARVAITGRRPAPLKAMAEECDVFPVAADMADTQGAARAVAQVADHFGGVDMLVANAGGHGFSRLGKRTMPPGSRACTTTLPALLLPRGRCFHG